MPAMIVFAEASWLPKAIGAHGHLWHMMTKDANIAISGNCCVYPQWLRVIIDAIIDVYLWSMSMYLSSKISQTAIFTPWCPNDVLIRFTCKYISKVQRELARFSRRSLHGYGRNNKLLRKTSLQCCELFIEKERSRVFLISRLIIRGVFLKHDTI